MDVRSVLARLPGDDALIDAAIEGIVPAPSVVWETNPISEGQDCILGVWRVCRWNRSIGGGVSVVGVTRVEHGSILRGYNAWSRSCIPE